MCRIAAFVVKQWLLISITLKGQSMKLDKELAIKILKAIEDSPEQHVRLAHRIQEFGGDEVFIFTMEYLISHELVNAYITYGMDETVFNDPVSLTQKGIDYLAADGGLGAELNVITIKIHEDTIKEFIRARIDQSNLPAQEKKRFWDRLKELPAASIEHLVFQLMDLGLKNMPQAVQLLNSM